MADLRATKPAYRAFAGVAILIQVLLLFQFFFMGLGWGGFWYVANLVQALVILAVAVVLIRTRPLLVLPLPLLSLLLMLLFQAIDPSTKTTECTEVELSAAAQLPPPPGTAPPEFQSEPANGCIARFETALSADQLLDHYRTAAQEAGWQVEEADWRTEEPDEVPVEPGRSAPEISGGTLLGMSSETITAAVSYERAGDEGPARNRLWVVVEIHDRER